MEQDVPSEDFESTSRLMAAAHDLVGLAQHALEVGDTHYGKGLLRQLLDVATQRISDLADYEGADDPAQLGRNMLHFATLDEREIMEVPPGDIDPSDNLSRTLRLRQEHYPAVIEAFESIVRRRSK